MEFLPKSPTNLQATQVINYGLRQANLGNDELGWEKTESWNIGFESEWLNSRLFVDLDVYASKTTDQIFARTIPSMAGFSSVLTSLGRVDNKGLELTLRSINMQKMTSFGLHP